MAAQGGVYINNTSFARFRHRAEKSGRTNFGCSADDASVKKDSEQTLSQEKRRSSRFNNAETMNNAEQG